MATNTSEWPLWSTTARLVVTNPAKLRRARRVADRMLDEIDAAASRFRFDSEINRIAPQLPRGVEVSELLARFLRVALDAAKATDGDVDPTLGLAMDQSGYDRDIQLLARPLDADALFPDTTPCPALLPTRAIVSRRPGWRSLLLVGRQLRLPANLALDLGATAKAFAADLVATTIARELGCGVLLSLGGDIAIRGEEPLNGWHVLVQDLPGDPATKIRMSAGSGVATSSTQKRVWDHGGTAMHHILDPRTGMPAELVWATVTVAASSCARANTLSTAAIVRGERAAAWLDGLGAPARLVRPSGAVLTVGGWPAEMHDPRLSVAV